MLIKSLSSLRIFIWNCLPIPMLILPLEQLFHGIFGAWHLWHLSEQIIMLVFETSWAWQHFKYLSALNKYIFDKFLQIPSCFKALKSCKFNIPVYFPKIQWFLTILFKVELHFIWVPQTKNAIYFIYNVQSGLTHLPMSSFFIK